MTTKLSEAQEAEIKLLKEKRQKLLNLILLIDPEVSGEEVGELQIKQHQAFLNAFPDERDLINKESK